MIGPQRVNEPWLYSSLQFTEHDNKIIQSFLFADNVIYPTY